MEIKPLHGSDPNPSDRIKSAAGVESVMSSEARFRLAVDASPNAMLMVNPEGKIEMFNAQAEKLFQYQQDEILGQAVEILVPKRFRQRHPRMRAMFAAHPETRKMGRKSAELFALRRDGAEIPVEIGLNPVTTVEGQHVLVAIVDITERKRMETTQKRLYQELADSNEALRQSNLKLQQFASIASHDLHAPLRHIGGLVQLLLVNYADELDDKAKLLINRTVQSVHTLQSLIDDLLMFSRMEAREVERKPIPLHKVYGEAVELLSASLHESNAKISCGFLPQVHADQSMMIHVFQNLLANSIKYRSDSPLVIQIEAEEQDAFWVVSFSDNGIGIDPRYHEQIFEVFQRAHHDPELKGNGLGLAICRSILQRHGGEITVESQPGKGSIFSIHLPKVPELEPDLCQ